jgi:hypothetical protein
MILHSRMFLLSRLGIRFANVGGPTRGFIWGYSALTTTLIHPWAEFFTGGILIRGSTMSSPSISSSPSSTTDPTTSIPTASASSGAGAGVPTTATLLFGFLIIFSAIFAAFLFLAFFWKIQQRRQTAFLPEFDDIRGTNRGVPKLWEVWVRDESSEKERNWENTITTTTTVSFCCAIPNNTVSFLLSYPLFGGVANPYPYPCMIRN